MSDNRLQQIELIESICRASRDTLMVALIKLIMQCQREELTPCPPNPPGVSTLYTTEILNLLRQAIIEERDTQ